MATIAEITQGQSYEGNAILGGGFSPSVAIDASPLEKLAAFTFNANENLYKQKQIDDAKAAEQLASAVNLNIYNAIPEYREDLLAASEKLKDFLRKNPNAVSYSRDPKGNMEFQEQLNATKNKIDAAKKTEVLYNYRKATIDKMVDSPEKELEQAELDSQLEDFFADGVDVSYNKKLNDSPKVNASDYKIGKVDLNKIAIITTNPNDKITTNTTYLDPNAIKGSAIQSLLGTQKQNLDEEVLKNLSPTKRKLAISRNRIQNSKIVAMENTVETIKKASAQVMAAYNADPSNEGKPFVLNAENVKKYGGVSFVTSLFEAKEIYNQKIEELNSRIGTPATGTDPTEKKQVQKSFVKMEDKDFLTPQGQLELEIFLQNGSTFEKVVDKDLKQTDDALNAGKLAETIAARESDAAIRIKTLAQQNRHFYYTPPKQDKDVPPVESTGNLWDLLTNIQNSDYINNGVVKVMKKDEIGSASNIGKAFEGDKRWEDSDGIAMIDGKLVFQKYVPATKETPGYYKNNGEAKREEIVNKGNAYMTNPNTSGGAATERKEQRVYPVNKGNAPNDKDPDAKYRTN
jgi:hypothetical protein